MRVNALFIYNIRPAYDKRSKNSSLSAYRERQMCPPSQYIAASQARSSSGASPSLAQRFARAAPRGASLARVVALAAVAMALRCRLLPLYRLSTPTSLSLSLPSPTHTRASLQYIYNIYLYSSRREFRARSSNPERAKA